jgi:hypothetical protein
MRTTVSLNDRLLKRARREAEARGLTLSDYLAELVRRDLDQPKKTPPKPFRLVTHDAKLAPGYDWRRLDEQTDPVLHLGNQLEAFARRPSLEGDGHP